MNVQNATDFTVQERQKYGILSVEGRLIGLEIAHLDEICVVREILPLLTSRSDVMGAINLRGSMIPLLDPMVLCGVSPMKGPPAVAAIIEFHGRSVAIACDEAVNISEFGSEDVQPLYASGACPSIPVHSGIITETGSINLIDPASILALADMPSAASTDEARRSSDGAGAALAYLTFEAGGATFALDAVKIFGTVPRQKIAVDTLTGGACLGCITYLGRRIPAMNATQVLGLGAALNREQPETVVVNFPDGHLLGFAVDEIQQIRMVRASEIRPVPDVFGDATTLFSGILARDDGDQVFLLDPEVLCARPELLTMSTLSDCQTKPVREENVADASFGENEADISRVRHRCLVFTAGIQVCAPITEVVSILPSPARYTPVTGGDASLLGFFSHDRETVPLVSLALRFGLASGDETAFRRTLLVGQPGQRVGFLVDSVDGIESSTCLAKSDDSPRISDRIAELKTSGKKHVLPHVALQKLAASVTVPAK